MNTVSHYRLLNISNRLLAFVSLLFVLSVLIAYTLPTIPIAVQISAHILIVVSSAAIKLCYLARITAQNALGLKVY